MHQSLDAANDRWQILFSTKKNFFTFIHFPARVQPDKPELKRSPSSDIKIKWIGFFFPWPKRKAFKLFLSLPHLFYICISEEHQGWKHEPGYSCGLRTQTLRFGSSTPSRRLYVWSISRTGLLVSSIICTLLFYYGNNRKPHAYVINLYFSHLNAF